jgi:hypothetical protein
MNNDPRDEIDVNSVIAVNYFDRRNWLEDAAASERNHWKA